MPNKEIDEKALLEAQQSGLNLQELAERFNVSKNTITRRLKDLGSSFDTEIQWERRAQRAVRTVAALQEEAGPAKVLSRKNVVRAVAEASGVKEQAAIKHVAKAVERGLLVQIVPRGRAAVRLPGAPQGLKQLYVVADDAESPQTSATYTITDIAPEKAWGLNTAVLIATPASIDAIITSHTS